LAASQNQPAAAAKVKAAESAWIAYRDAYLDAMFPAEDKQGVYGSIFPTKVDLHRASLARQQIVALKDLIKQYNTSR
jgi:hypothetical protein